MFEIMFTIIPIIAIGIFIFTFIMIFSPKARSKMMKRQMKTLKYMMEDNQDILTDLSKSALNVQHDILTKNEDALKNIATKQANINKEGIKIKSEAIKDGFYGKNIYCKYCGSSIDSDSRFCKNCGKQQ